MEGLHDFDRDAQEIDESIPPVFTEQGDAEKASRLLQVRRRLMELANERDRLVGERKSLLRQLDQLDREYESNLKLLREE